MPGNEIARYQGQTNIQSLPLAQRSTTVLQARASDVTDNLNLQYCDGIASACDEIPIAFNSRIVGFTREFSQFIDDTNQILIGTNNTHNYKSNIE